MAAEDSKSEEWPKIRERKQGGKTLAWQFRTRIGKGDVPWGELSQPGTPFDLRGYRWGRYRDKSMLYMVLELGNCLLLLNKLIDQRIAN